MPSAHFCLYSWDKSCFEEQVFGLTDNEAHKLFALASVMLNKTPSMLNQGQRVCLTSVRSEDGVPRPGSLTGRQCEALGYDKHIVKGRIQQVTAVSPEWLP